MNTLQLLRSSLFHFKDLKEAKNTPFWKTILYLLGLSILFALPMAYQVGQVLQEIRSDGQKIAARIPDFTIEDGKIQTDNKKGFIYQTNSIIFTFDPEGKRSEADISNDMIGNFISVGLLKDRAVVALPSSGITQSLLGSNDLSVSYKDDLLQDLTGQDLRETLEKTHIPFFMKALALLFTAYPAFINLLITIVIATLGALIYARLRMKRATFFECLKTMVYASTLPTIIATLLLFIIPGFDSGLFITFASLFIFAQAIKGFPTIQK